MKINPIKLVGFLLILSMPFVATGCEQVNMRLGETKYFGNQWTENDDPNSLPLYYSVSISTSGVVTVRDLTAEGPKVVLCYKPSLKLYFENLVYYQSDGASSPGIVRVGDTFNAGIRGHFMFGCTPELNCWGYGSAAICGDSEGNIYREDGVAITVVQ